jgi:hypothetical protein
MAERIDIDRLEVILASVGQHLIVEPVGAADAADRRDRGPWRERLLVAAVAVLVLSAAVASIAPARRVVSGWLRAGNIEVEVDPDLTVSPELPAFVDDIPPLDEERLAGRLGQPVPDVSGSTLGAPDAWWSPPELGILATWSQDATSLWIVATADTYPASLDKWLREPDAATSVPDLGQGGYIVEGAHIFQTPFRTVAANSVVAWTDGDLTFRLDSTMSRDRLLEVARSIAS